VRVAGVRFLVGACEWSGVGAESVSLAASLCKYLLRLLRITFSL
jgi:hypothetical protein